MNETFATKIAENLPRMYRVALRMLGCADAAQDVAQNVCVSALKGADKFDGRSDLATWLHRITVNCAHDHLRKRRQIEGSQSIWDEGVIGMLTMLEATPAEQAERDELHRLAMKLVVDLPEDCRSAFWLTQLDGYTYDEAAAIEHLSRGTVASRVYRARKLLMEQMNHHLAGEIP
jgi:RNA polymerase sigma-70 factor, ECF subfamily